MSKKLNQIGLNIRNMTQEVFKGGEGSGRYPKGTGDKKPSGPIQPTLTPKEVKESNKQSDDNLRGLVSEITHSPFLSEPQKSEVIRGVQFDNVVEKLMSQFQSTANTSSGTHISYTDLTTGVVSKLQSALDEFRVKNPKK